MFFCYGSIVVCCVYGLLFHVVYGLCIWFVLWYVLCLRVMCLCVFIVLWLYGFMCYMCMCVCVWCFNILCVYVLGVYDVMGCACVCGYVLYSFMVVWLYVVWFMCLCVLCFNICCV